MTNDITDTKLIALISEGNELAFKELYDRYVEKMFLYAVNVLNDKEICEDLVQNIFISIWTKREENEIDNVSGYLFRALKFQIFKYLRDRKLSLQDVTRMNLVDVSMGVDSAMEYDELEAVINGLIDQLPDRCKQIFILSRLKNKSNKEIAAELVFLFRLIKNQISKALGILRAHLKKEEFLYSNFLPIISLLF